MIEMEGSDGKALALSSWRRLSRQWEWSRRGRHPPDSIAVGKGRVPCG